MQSQGTLPQVNKERIQRIKTAPALRADTEVPDQNLGTLANRISSAWDHADRRQHGCPYAGPGVAYGEGNISHSMGFVSKDRLTPIKLMDLIDPLSVAVHSYALSSDVRLPVSLAPAISPGLKN